MRLSDEITELGQTVFRQCKKLSEITLSKNLTTIGESTFFSCDGFTRVEIPDGTQRIGSNAFSYCTNLKEVVIPKSVTQIGGAFESFAGCDSLTDVYYAGSEEDWNKIRFCTTLDKILKVRIHFNGELSVTTTTPAGTTTATETTVTTTVTTATEPVVPFMKGDVFAAMLYVAYTAVGRAGNLTADQMQAADIDESGSIDSTDVYYLLYYIALNGAGVRSTWADVVK